MIKTLEHFALGFFGYPDALTAYDEEIVIEGQGYNNTGALVVQSHDCCQKHCSHTTTVPTTHVTTSVCPVPPIYSS